MWFFFNQHADQGHLCGLFAMLLLYPLDPSFSVGLTIVAMLLLYPRASSLMSVFYQKPWKHPVHQSIVSMFWPSMKNNSFWNASLVPFKQHRDGWTVVRTIMNMKIMSATKAYIDDWGGVDDLNYVIRNPFHQCRWKIISEEETFSLMYLLNIFKLYKETNESNI